MNVHKQFGIFLFGSVVILSVARIRFPFRDMYLRSGSVPLQSENNIPESENDELIHRNLPSFSSGKWRLRHSSFEQRSDKDSCVLVVVNDIDEPVLLCWVDQAGVLRHFNKVNDRSIRDNSVSNVHGEYTYTGDHFVCIRCSDVLPSTLNDISEMHFIFSYTPSKAATTHTITLSKDSKRLRGAQDSIQLDLQCTPVEDKGEVIDSSNKVYDKRAMCGFTVYHEPGVFEDIPGFESAFTADIAKLSCLLPTAACSLLKAHTPIYINKALTYGTTKNPIIATSCCYHPVGGTGWLKNNGLSLSKEGCVEVFSAECYLHSREHWGTGGVLVHEFSHVYHDKHCIGGYDCVDIREVSLLIHATFSLFLLFYFLYSAFNIWL